MAEIQLIGNNGTYIFNPHEPKAKKGEGGMGIVYLGRNLHTHKNVAIKVIWKELAQNPRVIERAMQEGNLQIEHPNVLKMLDFVEKDGVYHIVSEFLEGQSLEDFIQQFGAVNPEYATEIIVKVLEGLAILHTHQPPIIHRDIKPSNIFLCNDGTIKIMDFGVVRISDGKRKSVTGMGTVIGTPHYSAPEQVQGEQDKINATTDIYAVGITLYEMLTGNPPFNASSEFATLKMQVESPIPANSKIDNSLFNVIKKATEKAQTRRFQSATEFIRALQQKNTTVSTQGTGGVVSSSSSNNWKIATIILGIILFIFVVLSITLANKNSSLEMERDNYSNSYYAEKQEKERLESKLSDITQKLENVTFKVGKADWNCNGGYNNGYAVLFKVSATITLKRLKVYVQESGNITLKITNSNGDTAFEGTYNLGSGKQILNVNADLVPDNYKISYTGSTTLYRNSDCANYPYDVGALSITGSTYSESRYYYYFYDWEYHLKIK
jgi:serine/threonine-protein kinase